MAEFVAAHILDDYHIGDRFAMWPLHVTVVPPFRAEDVEVVAQEFGKITAEYDKLQLNVGDKARFGEHIIVQKILPNPELSKLHSELIQVAESNGWEVSGRYTGNYYTPHITQKAGRSFDMGSILLDRLALVENIGQGYRVVKANLELLGDI